MLTTERPPVMLKLAFALSAFVLAFQSVEGQSIANGGFENGFTSWQDGASWFIFTDSTKSHSGAKYAFFGVQSDGVTHYPNNDDSVLQFFTVPSNTLTLTLRFWYRISSDDTSGIPHDFLYAKVSNQSGSTLATLATYSNTNASPGWAEAVIQLPQSYASQTIGIRFHGTTNATLKTVFRIDDVSLSSTQLLPNLTPYQPSGWSNKIVVSRATGTSVDSALTELDTLYVDWALINNGATSTSSTFYTRLLVDSVQYSQWYTDPPLPSGNWTGINDYPIGSLSVGTHTIQIQTDVTDTILESNETVADNVYTKTITINAIPTPSVLTSAATSTTSTSAVINGSISSDGGTSITDRRFDWGTATPLTQAVFSANIAVSGSNFSTTLTGLTPNTTYYFRAWARNGGSSDVGYSAGWGVGSILSFTTSPAQLPNLTPYQPSGWSNKIVVSKSTGTNTDDVTITSNDNVYVDWAYQNNGQAQTQFDPSASIYLDGSLVETIYASSKLQPASFNSRTDLPLGKLSVGAHSLEIIVDQPGLITESDESNADNRFSRTFTVTALGPVVGVTSPTSGSSFQIGTPVNITWTLSGVTTQVNYFKVAILDNGVEDASLNFFASLGSSSFSWTPQSSFVRSNLTARVRALDANGNILATAISPSFSTTSSGLLVARATVPAKVYLNSPATFSASGSTPVPGRPITSYAWEFYVGSTQVGTANVASPSFMFSWGTMGSAKLTVGDGFTTNTKLVEFALIGTGNPTNTDSGSSIDPVNSAIGNFVMSPTLLEVHARVLPFVFQAYYNSKAFQPGDTTPGPLGYGWSHSFETRISEPAYQDGVLSVIITFGDGHPETYRFENAAWNAQLGNYNKLTRADNGIFTLTTPNQIKHEFDASGRLASIIDRNGNTLSVVWNASPSRITSVILPGGPDANGNPRKIDFAYDAAGHLSKLTDPINRTVEFTVDAAHNLTAIKNPRGYSSTYTYDAFHQMLTGTDPRTNRFVRNVYQDRVVTEQYGVDDHKTTFEYPFTTGSTINFTRITRKATSGDEITEDHHNAKLQLLERKVWLTATTSLSTKAEYYDNGDRKAVIDRNNNRTEFEYIDGDVTKVTFADTSTISMTYSPYHDLLTRTNQLGIVEKREYDDPLKGNLVALTFPFDAAHPTNYRRSFTVDEFGQTTAATDANTHTTHAYFNEWGENRQVEDAETPPNAQIFDLDGIGRKTGVTDERGSHTTFTLNENGGAEVTTLPALPAPIGITQIKQVFDANDNLTSVEDPLHRFTYTEFDSQDRPYKVKNHNLATITTEFDDLGRAVRVQDPKLHYSNRVYDLAGRLTEARDQMGRKHVFTHDANGNVLTDIDDDGVKTETVWDEMNRPIKQRRYTSPTTYDETITHYNLLGQIDWTEDAASHVNHNRTYFYYNDAGQLIRLVEPAINGIAQEFTWTYDFEGNLLSATHPTPTGPKTRYQTWTARNQIATRTDENGKIERFFYNPVGKLDHFINANGQTIAFVYDALNRTTTIDYPGSAVDTQFTYDAAGQLIYMDDALGRTTWTYTALGQIETVTDPFGKSLAYHYDVNGNRDTVTYPGGKEAHYAFDDANALLSVTDWQTRTISRALTAAGRVATITYPNGITTTVGHDAAGRENDIQHQKGVAVPFIHFGYTFDPKGQIQEVTPTIHPLPKQAFTAATSTYTYDTANQLASIDGITVTHDNQGNVLTGKLSPLSTGTDTLTWDIEGRLTAATIAGVTSTSSYDGQGHRLQTTHGSTTTRYVMDSTGSLAQVMAETDGSGTITAYYLYLGGLAARILPNGDLSCYHTDRAGNVLALTDSGGSTTDLYQYDEFGVPAGSSGSSQNPFRYAGGFGVQTDANGTLFSRARVYHPDLGRFLSRDALFGSQMNGQSLNRYAAFLNDPYTNADPSGFVNQHAVSPSFYTSGSGKFSPAYIAYLRNQVALGNAEIAYQNAKIQGYSDAIDNFKNGLGGAAAALTGLVTLNYVQLGGGFSTMFGALSDSHGLSKGIGTSLRAVGNAADIASSKSVASKLFGTLGLGSTLTENLTSDDGILAHNALEITSAVGGFGAGLSDLATEWKVLSQSDSIFRETRQVTNLYNELMAGERSVILQQGATSVFGFGVNLLNF